MTAPIAPIASGTPAVPADVITPAEAAIIAAPPTPVAKDDAAHDIAAASKAMREKATAAANAPVVETPTVPVAAEAPVVTEQPRNADGTFASPNAPTEEVPAVPDATGDAAPPDAPVVEPKLFVLKGEEQRGEADMELDASDLPPEVVERLDRLQKQGMRRQEFDTNMRKVRTLQADLDAVETEIAVDPSGFVLNHVPPAKRQEIGLAILLENWSDFAPVIEQLWQDEPGRLRALQGIKDGVSTRRNDVVSAVSANRTAREIQGAVSELVPETADDATAQEFFQTSITLLQARAQQNERVTSADVPKLLDAHRRRYFGAAQVSAPPAPARPKLAVRPTPGTTPAAAASPAPKVLTQAEVTRQIQARANALNVAPLGAGTAAVQRPGGPANETIEEASKRLRATAR